MVISRTSEASDHLISACVNSWNDCEKCVLVGPCRSPAQWCSCDGVHWYPLFCMFCRLLRKRSSMNYRAVSPPLLNPVPMPTSLMMTASFPSRDPMAPMLHSNPQSQDQLCVISENLYLNPLKSRTTLISCHVSGSKLDSCQLLGVLLLLFIPLVVCNIYLTLISGSELHLWVYLTLISGSELHLWVSI